MKIIDQNEGKIVKYSQNNMKARYNFVRRIKMSEINKRAVPNKSVQIGSFTRKK